MTIRRVQKGTAIFVFVFIGKSVMSKDDSRLDSAKYGLLKLIDVSGFKVFDPVVRLCFGEEPGKQVGEIVRYMIVPIIFVAFCIGAWSVIAPRHKTKAGRVPDPSQVWDALEVNHTLHVRENEKEADFNALDSQREHRIALVKATLKEKEAQEVELKKKLAKVEAASQAEIDQRLAPLTKRLGELKESNTESADARKAELISLSEKVVANTTAEGELTALMAKDVKLKSEAKEKEKRVKDLIEDVKSNPPKELKRTQLAYNGLAIEISHLKKRLDYLGKSNRAEKVAVAQADLAKKEEKLKSADEPAGLLAAAKSIVRSEEKVDRIASQSYPRGTTIWFQVWRSLFTVFVGFIIAAVVAIPFGIMCGLNRVVMACLTPIISIFKPVSPVVWLLIFQIVVGAFFPNPETHPFFVMMSNIPWISGLKVNPAMVYSACTVAMCAVWPALVNTALGVSSIDQDHLNVAKVLKLGLWQRLTKIVIPSSLPLVFAGLRISLGVGWMVLIAAEALSGSEGLGKFVWDQYQNGGSMSFANIIFACFVVGIIGFFLDRMMIILQRSVSFDDGAAVV